MRFTGLGSDIRFACRLVRADWRFSATLVTTLAIGIAASGAIFNVVNATLFRPLPIPDEARVYRLQDYTLGRDGGQVRRSNRVPNFLDIRTEARAFSQVIGMRSLSWSLIGGATPVPVDVGLVSPGTFELLGVRAAEGRLFTADEERRGLDAGVMVISHALWQRQFGGRADVVGRSVRVEDHTPTIVGVLPAGFRFPYDVEAWLPEQVDPRIEASLAVFARLAPDATPAQAQAELEAIATRAEAARPVTNRGLRFAMTPIRESLVGSNARTSLALMGAAVLLLVLASANVANLLLARGIRRTREIAVRAALGAQRARQVRQMLVESIAFAGLGTAAGLAVAHPLSRLLVGLVPNTLRDQLGLTATTVDMRAALFAAVVTGGVGVLAGLVPALKLARADVSDTLRQHTRGASSGHRLMRGLVVGEVALAVVLLVSAGLMVENLQRLLAANLGLRADALYAVALPLPPRYAEGEPRIQVVRRLHEAARGIPGVERAGLSTWNPLDRGSFGASLEAEDARLAPGQSGIIVNHRQVTPEWLETAGVALLRGRTFTAADNAGSQPVAVVSRRLAERLWPGEEAVGRRLRQVRPEAPPWITVVGVVGDVRDYGEWAETWYVPYEQHAATLAAGTVHLMVRSQVEPGAVVAALRAAAATIDPLLPVPEAAVMTTLWREAQTPQRMGALVSALFGVSGLLLAALGTYGVLAYLVSARAREFGIRQALGARPRDVVAMVLRDSGALAVVGLVLGGVLSVGAVQALRAVTTEVSAVPDALPWLVGAALVGAALIASVVPARRATRVHPVEVMRTE
ncbi:MAG: ABC transporter permease [Vicinamibacterales bacterium]